MGRRIDLFAWSALALAAVAAVPVAAHAAPERRPRAVLAFYAADPQDVLVRARDGPPVDSLLRFLDDQPALRVGLWSSTQSRYERQQALLDISQGARQPTGLYANVDDDGDGDLDELRFDVRARSFTNWHRFHARARGVSQTLRPGLLSRSVPGGAAFVAAAGAPVLPAIAAADERGRVTAISVGAVGAVAARVRMQLRTHRLVVVSLPVGREGRAQLSELVRRRAPNELLVIVQLPDAPRREALVEAPQGRFVRQPAFAIADGRSGSPRSRSTRRDGLVSAIDIAPTILAWLGIEPPDRMRGLKIEDGKPLVASRLEELRARWSRVRDGRQAASFTAILSLGGILFLLLGTWRHIQLAARAALRIAALGCLWWPSTVLLAARLEPAGRAEEVLFIAGVSIALGALTDRLLPWPRAAILPALVCLVTYTVDLALGGPLLTTSVLGPSVAAGSRFYGVSNELEPILPIVLLTGLAAATTGRETAARTLILYGSTGLALLIVVGWGRLGADVGGVITVAAGVAVATLVRVGGRLTLRRAAVIVVIPVAALGLLVALDLGLSGRGHLATNLRRTGEAAELWELVARRYELAWEIVRTGNRLAYVLASLLAVAFAWRNRDRLYGALPHRGWAAALIGGLAAGVAGALTNDSGPVLFINAVLGLAVLTGYLLGRPESRAPATTTADVAATGPG